MAAGIEVRHVRSCSSRKGGRCSCRPAFQAHVWSQRDAKRIRKTFPTKAAAVAWRQDAQVALRRGTMRADDGRTVEQVAQAWIEGARTGTIRTRSGDPYKPSAVRAYEQSLALRVLPKLGARKFGSVRRVELQDLVDELHATGLSASTVQCSLLPLRAMYRRAVARGELDVNPTSGLELPAVRSGRDRIASPDEAANLLAALDVDDRALWATALYAGLRRGELMALDWSNVDLNVNTVAVEAGWDIMEGRIATKSRQNRRVPIATGLRGYLLEHKLRSGRSEGLVFGVTTSRPFRPEAVTERAGKAWKAAGLDRITLHECRHTFASLAIAAGVNAKALSTYMGHAAIATTLDKYGHLMPGNEAEAAQLLDDYLSRGHGHPVASAKRPGRPKDHGESVCRRQ